jgi:hypothetical protein
MESTNAGSPIALLPLPDGRSVQLLAPAAVAPGTVTEETCSVSVHKLKILMALLHGLLCEVLSGDKISFAVSRAEHICQDIPKEIWDKTLEEFLAWRQAAVAGNPLRGMF